MSYIKLIKSLLFNLILICPLISIASVELPDFGASSGATLTLNQEQALGNLYMQQMRGMGIIYEDAYLNDYLNSISKKLVTAIQPSGRRFTFFLVNNPQINAFALPGGYIGVHTGLLAAATSESEVASVLAHEIAHVTQRHVARFFEKGSQMTLPALAALLGSAILATQNPSAGMGAMTATMATVRQSAINFQQQHEKEADRVGIDTLKKAGYDPHAMATFFERLLEMERFNSSNIPEFLRSHPLTASRVADAKHRDKSAPVALKNHRSFLLAQTRISVMQSKELQRTLQHYREGVNSGQFYDASVARYGYALALLRHDNLAAASEQAQYLVNTYPNELPFWLLLADIQSEQNKFPEAKTTLTKGLERFTNNRALREQLAETLLQLNHAEEARQILRKLARENPEDLQTLSLLAQANAKAGRKAEAHAVRADELLLIGDIHGAIHQLEIAHKDADSEFTRESVAAKLVILKAKVVEKHNRWL